MDTGSQGDDLQDSLHGIPLNESASHDGAVQMPPTVELISSGLEQEPPSTKDDSPRISKGASHEQQPGSIHAEVAERQDAGFFDSGPHASLTEVPTVQRSIEMRDDVGVSGPAQASLTEVPTVQRSIEMQDDEFGDSGPQASLMQEVPTAQRQRRPLVDVLGIPVDVDVESLSDPNKYSTSTIQSLSYSLVHSMRLYGWLPWFLLALAKYPIESIAGVLALYALRLKTDWWSYMVLRFMRYASSPKPRIVRANSVPYDAKKQYMITCHPHNIMLCGLWNVMCRFTFSDEKGGQFHKSCDVFDDLTVSLCAAPALQFVPLYGEMYRDQAFSATKTSVDHVIKKLKRSPVLVPGGFSEAVYTNFKPNQEVSYILGRYGFIKIAIENGLDIIPFYTFGSQQMYHTMEAWRHERAVWAQKTGIPLVPWWGKWGTSTPLNDEAVTVTFDPFPISKYTLEDVERAHADFCVYLKKCFDEHKHVSKYTKDSELLFAGKDQKPARL